MSGLFGIEITTHAKERVLWFASEIDRAVSATRHAQPELRHALADTWSGHDDMRAAREQALLFLHSHTADDGGAAEARVGGELPESASVGIPHAHHAQRIHRDGAT